MQIRSIKGKIQIDYLYIMTFFLYSVCYFISAYYDYKIFDIEYIALGLLLCLCLSDVLKTRGGKISKKSIYFREMKNSLQMMAVLLSISAFFQIIHLHLLTLTLKNAFFLVMPIILVWLLNLRGDYSEVFFNIVLVLSVAYFCIRFRGQINLSMIRQISFLDSFSPYEVSTTSITDIFFYCTVFFAYKKKYFRMLIASIFGIFSFKRLMVVGISVVLVVTFVNYIRTYFGKTRVFRNQFVSKRLCWIVTGMVCLIPFCMNFLMMDKITSLLSGIVGMDINQFIKGRFDLLNYVIDAAPTNYGLGTIVSFMKSSSVNYVRGAGNLHNDIYRLYYETTIVGLFCYTKCMMNNTRRNRKSFWLTTFFLINLLVSNTLINFMPMLLFHLINCVFIRKSEEV